MQESYLKPWELSEHLGEKRAEDSVMWTQTHEDGREDQTRDNGDEETKKGVSEANATGR